MYRIRIETGLMYVLIQDRASCNLIRITAHCFACFACFLRSDTHSTCLKYWIFHVHLLNRGLCCMVERFTKCEVTLAGQK